MASIENSSGQEYGRESEEAAEIVERGETNKNAEKERHTSDLFDGAFKSLDDLRRGSQELVEMAKSAGSELTAGEEADMDGNVLKSYEATWALRDATDAVAVTEEVGVPKNAEGAPVSFPEGSNVADIVSILAQGDSHEASILGSAIQIAEYNLAGKAFDNYDGIDADLVRATLQENGVVDEALLDQLVPALMDSPKVKKSSEIAKRQKEDLEAIADIKRQTEEDRQIIDSPDRYSRLAEQADALLERGLDNAIADAQEARAAEARALLDVIDARREADQKAADERAAERASELSERDAERARELADFEAEINSYGVGAPDREAERVREKAEQAAEIDREKQDDSVERTLRYGDDQAVAEMRTKLLNASKQASESGGPDGNVKEKAALRAFYDLKRELGR